LRKWGHVDSQKLFEKFQIFDKKEFPPQIKINKNKNTGRPKNVMRFWTTFFPIL
jgi:hypothetical protein